MTTMNMEAIFNPKTATASSQKIVEGSHNIPPCKFPPSATNEDVDCHDVATKVIDLFNSALDARDWRRVAALFMRDGIWRDHLALSWDLHTIRGRDQIAEFLNGNRFLMEVSIDTSAEHRKPQLVVLGPVDNMKGISFYLNITTSFGKGRGIVRLAELDGNWQIWTLYTVLEQPKAVIEHVGDNRPRGVQQGATPGRKNWLDRRIEEEKFEEKDPDVIIIGAGQAGLTLGARLKMLGIPALIIDKNQKVGDNWRKRYHQLTLHDPVWYDHMPYMPFPEHWPVYTPKDKLADWLEGYVKALELNVWTKSHVSFSKYSDEHREWVVSIFRSYTDGTSEYRHLRPKHIVLATGHSGKKHLPSIPGMDMFQGDMLCHSSEFPGATKPLFPGNNDKKSAIVVGACNSAHDICQDFYEKGYGKVTMVQRSSTCIISADALLKINIGGLYSQHGPPVEDADIALWGFPNEVFKAIQADLTKFQVEFDAELFAGLNKAGFELDLGIDNSGLYSKYIQRGGGYYFDMGASQLIIDGKVKVKQGVEVVNILPRGVRFSDDTVMEADEIVFATGYENMKTMAGEILGEEAESRLNSSVWGWDEEGEMRGIWRDTGHPGLWFMGGSMAFCRYFSRVLALQIWARVKGHNPSKFAKETPLQLVGLEDDLVGLDV